MWKGAGDVNSSSSVCRDWQLGHGGPTTGSDTDPTWFISLEKGKGGKCGAGVLWLWFSQGDDFPHSLHSKETEYWVRDVAWSSREHDRVDTGERGGDQLDGD